MEPGTNKREITYLKLFNCKSYLAEHKECELQIHIIFECLTDVN